MTTSEATFSKLKTCEAILKKCEGYGTNDSEMTMGTFKAIINEVINDAEKELTIQYHQHGKN